MNFKTRIEKRASRIPWLPLVLCLGCCRSNSRQSHSEPHVKHTNACKNQKEHPWSSGYDVSPTRWRSRVRSSLDVFCFCAFVLNRTVSSETMVFSRFGATPNSLFCKNGHELNILHKSAGVSRAGARTWLQIMGHGDMQGFNSSSSAVCSYDQILDWKSTIACPWQQKRH